MTNPLDISTNLTRIPIRRDGEHVGELVFNPASVMFAEKFYKIVEDFKTTMQDYAERYDALEKNKKHLPVDMNAALSLLRETCEYTREKIDYVFGEGTSQLVFGDALVLEVFPQFFDGVTPYIRTARTEKIAPYLVKKPVIEKRRKRKKELK